MTYINPQEVLLKAMIADPNAQPGDLVRALRAAGLHIISDVTISETEPEPTQLGVPNFGNKDWREGWDTKVEFSGQIDDQCINATQFLAREALIRANHDYKRWILEGMQREYLEKLGENLFPDLQED